MSASSFTHEPIRFTRNPLGRPNVPHRMKVRLLDTVYVERRGVLHLQGTQSSRKYGGIVVEHQMTSIFPLIRARDSIIPHHVNIVSDESRSEDRMVVVDFHLDWDRFVVDGAQVGVDQSREGRESVSLHLQNLSNIVNEEAPLKTRYGGKWLRVPDGRVQACMKGFGHVQGFFQFASAPIVNMVPDFNLSRCVCGCVLMRESCQRHLCPEAKTKRQKLCSLKN